MRPTLADSEPRLRSNKLYFLLRRSSVPPVTNFIFLIEKGIAVLWRILRGFSYKLYFLDTRRCSYLWGGPRGHGRARRLPYRTAWPRPRRNHGSAPFYLAGVIAHGMFDATSLALLS